MKYKMQTVWSLLKIMVVSIICTIGMVCFVPGLETQAYQLFFKVFVGTSSITMFIAGSMVYYDLVKISSDQEIKDLFLKEWKYKVIYPVVISSGIDLISLL